MLPLDADDPRVIGEFRLHARLGAGGMGRVYLGSSPGGRAVAVKVIHAHLARDAAFVDRFRREVAAAQAVSGGYAAPVVAAGPDDDPPWMATAYVAGPSLQEAVAETGPLPEDAVLKLAAGLIEALRAIHDSGLVHRDLKPDNVLLADDGPRVIDFGIARALDGTVLTSAGSVLGTPSFMSPEQAQGQPAGPASDVFSLGGVVYFAATGTRPFGSGNPSVLLYRIVHTEPDLGPLPARIRDLVASCLAKDPAERPGLASLAASLMDAVPDDDAPVAFWPAPVARLIADQQARFAAGLPEGEAPGQTGTPGETGAARTPTETVAPADLVAPASSAASPRPSAPPGDPAAPPAVAEPATETVRAGAEVTASPAPGSLMGRRRALAVLAGAATAGLAVAGYELTLPKAAAAGNLTARRPSPSPSASAFPTRPAAAVRPHTEVWNAKVNGPVASVFTQNGVVYAGTSDRAVYAFDAQTGRALWHHLMEHGATGYMTLTGDGALVAANGYNGVAPTDWTGGVYSLDASTGKLLWSVDAIGVVGLDSAKNVVYAGAAVKDDLTGGVTALAARTGELLWTYSFPTEVDLAGGVAQSGGVVYATTARGEVFALSAASGDLLWRYSDPAVSFSQPPTIADGVVYACNSSSRLSSASPVLYAVEARTGRALWRRPLGSGLVSFIPGVESGLIFVGVVRKAAPSSPDASELMALNAATGQPLWQVPIGGNAWSATSAPGNLVYSGDGLGKLDAWQATTGNHVWSYQAAGALDAGVVVAGGIAYAGSSNGRVYAVATGS
jgi:outer membrane protein assembly factor BamB